MTEKNNRPSFLTTEFYLAIFLLVVLIAMRILAKDFYSINNIMSLLNTFSYTLIAAIGMNMIIITSNIDVSAGALISVVCLFLRSSWEDGYSICRITTSRYRYGRFIKHTKRIIHYENEDSCYRSYIGYHAAFPRSTSSLGRRKYL